MLSNANFISDSVIGLDKVSVCYQIPSDPIHSFKEYAIRLLQGGMQTREHWALSNINLHVQKGEIVGVIGNNGAGKSTLLKVISKILPPTEGQIYIKGDISPILEIGAGFHLELTGKENIYLCGTLLGHSRREISSRMAEIVDFADIDSFINAPLRTYSKGMTARLGFAVAATWRSDILILDEALSVGDNSFQKKCLARINSFSNEGTIILLVTHNLDVIRSICTRAIWLDEGRLRLDGDVMDIISTYQNNEKRKPHQK